MLSPSGTACTHNSPALGRDGICSPCAMFSCWSAHAVLSDRSLSIPAVRGILQCGRLSTVELFTQRTLTHTAQLTRFMLLLLTFIPGVSPPDAAELHQIGLGPVSSQPSSLNGVMHCTVNYSRKKMREKHS